MVSHTKGEIVLATSAEWSVQSRSNLALGEGLERDHRASGETLACIHAERVKNSTFSVWISKCEKEKPCFDTLFCRNVENPSRDGWRFSRKRLANSKARYSYSGIWLG